VGVVGDKWGELKGRQKGNRVGEEEREATGTAAAKGENG
jgi:hypothetical protein